MLKTKQTKKAEPRQSRAPRTEVYTLDEMLQALEQMRGKLIEEH